MFRPSTSTVVDKILTLEWVDLLKDRRCLLLTLGKKRRRKRVGYNVWSVLIINLYLSSSFMQKRCSLQQNSCHKRSHQKQRSCTLFTSFLNVLFYYRIVLYYKCIRHLHVTDVLTPAGHNRDSPLCFLFLYGSLRAFVLQSNCLLTHGSTSLIRSCWL